MSGKNIALVVDLDGTLVRSDLLFESVLLLLARSPLHLFLLPLWLIRGRAWLKREIAARVTPDPSLLPYDDRVLDLLSRTSQRPRVLCTASHVEIADSVAGHLGLFEEVIGTRDGVNLDGHRKADALVSRFGESGFDYLGNAKVDLAVWRRARQGWVVNSGRRLARSAEKHCALAAHWPTRSSVVRSWFKALRLHQWLKNLLVFVPLLASHQMFEPAAVAKSLLTFVAFGLCASGVYLLNDLLDLDADRRHARKCSRPFAAGDLPVLHGLAVAPFLTTAGVLVAWAAGSLVALVLTVYYAITLAYSFRLKRFEILDVITLAGLYTIRIVAGAAAVGTMLSFWLLAFSVFTFLGLAVLKRYTELQSAAAVGKHAVSGRGYTPSDRHVLLALGGACSLISVLVLCLYINSPESVRLYSSPRILWATCPLLLYWFARVWLLAARGKMHDDPIVFAAKDGVSLAVLGMSASAFALAI